eukprot:CAMPEP_0115524808 /NCGR_PEP_ID=MMETSP0271-20121206/81386_1 /TAXON_ID=71861 /ORGANISM="Scrippsiella trochoidea, Strain CCMP3099" /LENGTH=35 /DNA_ID= /DNA_START= /DNA_END= /DNA_ORIENTATION=
MEFNWPYNASGSSIPKGMAKASAPAKTMGVETPGP